MKSISAHLRPSFPRVPNPFRAVMVLPPALARIVSQSSVCHPQSLASVSFSLKQSPEDIRGTTRLTAAATCANCSSGDVRSSFPLSSVDAWVVRITSGSATGTLPSRPAISAKLLPPSCQDPSAAFLAALAGPLRHVEEHGYATTAITATRKYVVAIENANDNARFGVSRLDCLLLAAHPKIVGTAEPIPDPDTTIRL